MDKLISQDALLNILRNWRKECHEDAEAMGGEAVIAAELFDDVITTVEDMPTMDVAPVVHGRWIKTDYKPMIFTKCSICDKRVERQNKSNYCPNCGVKMDGGTHDT